MVFADLNESRRDCCEKEVFTVMGTINRFNRISIVQWNSNGMERTVVGDFG